jgi:hypothetical protein
VGAALIKPKIEWMCIIKTHSLTVSYNFTTDIGNELIIVSEAKDEAVETYKKWRQLGVVISCCAKIIGIAKPRRGLYSGFPLSLERLRMN